MSQKPHPDVPPDDPNSLSELLVAYLDGEVDAEESRRVEGILASDAHAREELARLERTWLVLDCLNREPVDERFTKSTLEMVALAAAADLQQEQETIPRRRKRWATIGVAGTLLAIGAGFSLVWCLRPTANRQLLDDLPVLEDLDELRQIDDIEFLRQLYHDGVFDKNGSDHG
jgi:anti-sigma factor RsiW